MRHLVRPLAALSLLLVALPALSAVRYLPGAAETPGQSGAYFSSTLVLSNTSTSPVEATVSLIPPKETTAPVPAPVTLTLQAGETRRVDSVLRTLFAASHLFGTLQIEGGAGLLSDLRTLNISDPAGTYGVGLLPVAEAALLSEGETGYASWVEQSADAATGYRTNVSLTLVAPGTTVELRIFDSTGSLRGTTAVSSAQPGVYQARIADLVSPGALEVGHVEIRVLAGRAFGGTIVNDNVTSDAIVVPAERSPSGTTDLLLPGVAYTNGALGTFWNSDLRLFNPGSSPVTVRVETVGIAAPPVPPIVRTLEAGAVLSIPRVLEAFHLPVGVAGALRVRAPAPVLAAARTGNLDPTGVRPGTLAGQVLPVNFPAGLLPAGSTGTFAGLDQSSSVPGVRTNLALVGGPDGSSGTLVLRDATSGRLLASASYSVGAGEWLQRNLGEWFPSAAGSTSRSSAKAELLAFPAGSRVDVVPSAGSLAAYVSRVDNATGDPIVRPLARVE